MVTRRLRCATLMVCTATALGAQGRTTYDAQIRWTSYGIPHVKASDPGSLGFGFAYATATNAFCTIAYDVAMVNGELSRFLGPGEGRSDSDVFHRAMLGDSLVRWYNGTQGAQASRFTRGYVAGYNRYLREHRDALPTACRGAAWVRPITVNDVTRLTIGFGIRYGAGRYQKEMATATPPGERRTGSLTTDFGGLEGIGSNAVAMGRDVTASGRGLLLGNPHYPWQGSSRFHLIHLTIPGDVDVMGASLYSTNRVAIGFNKDMAWTHTVSTGARSTLYALDLNPDDPTQYRYGTTWRRMRRVPVSVAVKEADGAVTTVTRTTFFTHYGPVLASDQLPWTATRAYAVRDVNLANDRSAATYDRLSRARSVDDVDAAIREQGVAFTNTIAADRAGMAYYADISLVPNLDSATLARCRVRPAGVPAAVIVLNGADETCEWKRDPRAKVAGAMPPAQMPSLRRTDVVSNANDSYWLSSPAAKLEGFSPIIGDERTARSLRTRAGLAFIAEALDSGRKAAPQTLESMLLSHRNFGAELLLDDLLTVCVPPLEPVAMTGGSVDLQPACDALRQWDRRETVESRGAQVWREFWRQAARTPGLYRVPFDPNDPTRTPRGLAVGQPAVREAVRRSLARALQLLRQANVPVDATLGSIQYDMRGSERIPIPGGQGGTGMWSVITTDLTPQGYTPIIHGNSYIQIVGWTPEGAVDARGIVTYSQSDNPDSPHFGDLTRLYAQGRMIRLPFSEAEILADPALRTIRLRQ